MCPIHLSPTMKQEYSQLLIRAISLSPPSSSHAIPFGRQTTAHASQITEQIRLEGTTGHRSPGPTLLLKQDPLEQVPQDCVQTVYEYLQGKRLAVCLGSLTSAQCCVCTHGLAAWPVAMPWSRMLTSGSLLPLTGTDFFLSLSPVQTQPMPTPL